MRTRIITAAWALALLGGSACRAQPDGDHPGPHLPPPEALAACANLTSGAACAFDAPDGSQHAGRCWAPAHKKLACRPAEPPPEEPQ